MPADALEVPVNLIVEKADHLQAEAFQISLPSRVMAAAGVRDMTVAVKLNDQPGRGAVEVNDIIADGALPPEADRAGAEAPVDWRSELPIPADSCSGKDLRPRKASVMRNLPRPHCARTSARRRTGAQLKKKTYAARTENRPLSLGVRFNLFSLCACSVTKAVVQYRYIKIISSWEAIT